MSKLRESKNWSLGNNQPDSYTGLISDKGNVLIISNQPYVAYQHSVVRSVLPESFRVESVGHAASAQEKVSTIVDSLARQIYLDYHRLKKRLLEAVHARSEPESVLPVQNAQEHTTGQHSSLIM